MLEVKGKAPTRVDLAGGTIDLWPVYNLLRKKATVNVGVDLPAEVTVRTQNHTTYAVSSRDLKIQVEGTWNKITAGGVLPLIGYCLDAVWSPDLPGLEITTEARSPAGAGLGGSSCLALTIVACLQALRARLTGEGLFDESQLVETAQNLESRIIKAPTGCQDYWGAARGALNVISFPETGETVATYPADDVSQLSDQILLVYSGKSRASAINNWEIFKRVFDGDLDLLAKLQEIGEVAAACGDAVSARQWTQALALSEQEWQLRVDLWPAIETSETKQISAAALRSGAQLARVCGAGGGGVMAIFVPTAARTRVMKAVSEAGGEVLPAGIANYGLNVTINEF